MNLLAEEYIIDRVEARGGSGAYIKQWTWNDQFPHGGRVDLGSDSGGGDLHILVGSDGASLSVDVTDMDGRVVSNPIVALIPTSATNEAEAAAAMLCGEADQKGHFSRDAIPPGRYRVLAVNPVDGAANQVGWGHPKDLAANLVSTLWADRASTNIVDIAGKSKVELNLKVENRLATQR
jgi:hypothetical protein